MTDAPPPLVITIHTCPANHAESQECQQLQRESDRIRDEVDLRNLIWQDLANQKTGTLDLSLRAHITAICKRLAKKD
jgi:hypothetical protein